MNGKALAVKSRVDRRSGKTNVPIQWAGHSSAHFVLRKHVRYTGVGQEPLRPLASICSNFLGGELCGIPLR